MTQPRLFALLAGINDYRPPISRLGGCRNDILRVEEYLKEQAPFFRSQDIRVLLDAQATKDELVRQFREHLGKAGPGDVAFFYFAGHGTREQAEKTLWPEETDENLECMVCYNPSPDTPFLLADKELRYLIGEIGRKEGAQESPQIITMFDCCHSGDNTRSLLALQSTGSAEARRTPYIFPQRSWEQFIFHDRVSREAVASGAVGGWLPEAPHIQFGACQDQQLAKEDYLVNKQEKSGVFSTFLLEILRQAGGRVSYYDLKNRLKNHLKYRYSQVPQVFFSGGAVRYQYRGFLNREVEQPEPMYAEMIFHPVKGWMLQMGALHGISPRAGTITALVGKEPVQGEITAVEPDVTLLSFSEKDAARLDKNSPYRCLVDGFLSQPLALFIRDEEGDARETEKLAERLRQNIRNLTILEEEAPADFTLHLTGGEYRITFPCDPFRPLVNPLSRKETGAEDELVAYLKQIAQWTYVKELESAPADRKAFDGPPLEVRFFTETARGVEHEVSPKGEVAHIPYARKKWSNSLRREEWTGNIRIEVTNRSRRTVYAAFIYLPMNFAVDTRLLSTEVRRLDPGQSVVILEGEMDFEPHLRDYNWPASLSYIKIIASTEDNLNVTPLHIEDGLPLPPVLDGGTRGGDRGIKKGGEEDAPAEEGWITQRVTLEMPNPEYNRVDRSRLQEMLRHRVLAEYARGLYMDESAGEGELKLKKGLEWLEDPVAG